MNKEAEGRLNNGHTNSNTIVSKQDIGRIRTLTKQPEESVRDNLIVDEEHDEKMCDQSIIHGHVLAGMGMNELH